MHGFGVIRFTDGTFYKGNWSNNEKDLNGIY